MKRAVFISIILAAVLITVTPGMADRPDKDWKNWFGNISLGYNMAQGTFGDIADDDWTLSGGATYWPEGWAVGLELELGYNSLGLSSAAIRAINDAIDTDPENEGNITGGDIDVWSGTVNVVWSPDTGRVSPYLSGGVGLYYLDGKVTSTGLVYYPPVCDPWYWWCYPGGVGTGSIVEGSHSTSELGFNLGIGLNVEMDSGSQLFFEATYHMVDTDRESTEYLPIVVGYRW